MSFFVAGGTVPPGSPSYVERSADRELFKALLSGEYGYVLNSRQMGKSSLAVRTIAKLNEAGVRTAFVDLTRIGSTGADPERWYGGLLLELGRALGLRSEAAVYLKSQTSATPSGRFFGFLADEVLARIEGPLVVFVDEVDATRTLPFPADDLFAGIRQAWNARAEDPRYARLTFCLLGAAFPSDLIRDPRMTPFNVGRRIELRDFTAQEAEPFASVVGPEALRSVLAWTGGHPFLTQSLCAAAEGKTIDVLVRERYLDARARDADTNLADVANRLLGVGDPEVTDGGRADTLSLYEVMLKGKPVADDEANPSAARIKMSGIARTEEGRLKVRNRIYEQAFDRAWVRENMPGQELRRQRRAFWKGALRTGAVAILVIATVGGLAWNNARLAREANGARSRAEYETYVASMNLMPGLAQVGNFERMAEILRDTERSPARGWEWGYWKGQVTPTGDWTDALEGSFLPAISPNGRWLASRAGNKIRIFDPRDFRLVDEIEVPGRSPFVTWIDDDRLLTQTFTDRTLRLVDRRQRRAVRDYGAFFMSFSRANGRKNLIVGYLQGKPGWLDLGSGRFHPLLVADSLAGWGSTNLSPNGRFCAFVGDTAPPGPRGKARAPKPGVLVFETERWTVAARIPLTTKVSTLSFSPDGSRLVVGSEDGVALWDWRKKRLLSIRHDFPGHTLTAEFSSDGRYLSAVGFLRQGALYEVRGDRLKMQGEALKGVLSATFVPGTHRLLAGYDRYRAIDADAFGRSTRVKVEDGRYFWRERADGLRVQTDTRVIDVDLSGEPKLRSRLAKAEVVDDAEGLSVDMKDPAHPRIRIADGTAGFPSPQPIDGGFGWSFPLRDRALMQIGVGKVRMIDLRTGEWGRRYDLGAEINAIIGTHDGSAFTVAYLDGSIAQFDAASGREQWRKNIHAWPIAQIRLTRDERRILTAGQDQTAGVIDRSTGDLVFRLKGHYHILNGIDESPDGRRFVTASGDRTIRLWDATTGREMTSILFPHYVERVHFSQDGRRLFVSLSGGDFQVLSSEVER